MATVLKIDANATSLLWAEEASYKTLAGTEDWHTLEPNTYADFGAQTTLVARDPITDTRQRKKGAIVGLDASGGFNMDLVQHDLQELNQGFFFNDLEPKDEFGGAGQITAVDDSPKTYAGTGIGTMFPVGSILMGSGFTDPANNGRHTVTVSAADLITVSEDTAAETPGAGAKLVLVGFQYAAGDADIDASGTLPRLTSSAKDPSDFGLQPGEHVWIGGDAAGTSFGEAVNNGLARVKRVSASPKFVEFDWTPGHTMVDAGTTGALTVEVFFGRVLKNGKVLRSYQLERRLGAPDDAAPSEIQAEYLIGAVGNTMNWNIPAEGKVSVDYGFVAADDEQVAAGDPLRSDDSSGDIIAASGEQPFNTTSDARSIKLAVYDPVNANPTPLFAFVTDLSLSFSNNVSGLKAIGTLGSFAVAVGNFTLSGSMSVYFVDVASLQAVRDNSDVTMSVFLAKEHSGLAISLPLLGLGDGRPVVAKDQAIKLPIKADAASGEKLYPTLNHTAMLVYFDYLPAAAY